MVEVCASRQSIANYGSAQNAGNTVTNCAAPDAALTQIDSFSGSTEKLSAVRSYVTDGEIDICGTAETFAGVRLVTDYGINAPAAKARTGEFEMT